MASFTGAITLVGYGAARGTSSGSFTVPSGQYFDGAFSVHMDTASTVSAGGTATLQTNITAGGSNVAVVGGLMANASTINVLLSYDSSITLKLGPGTYTITPSASNVSWAISGHFIK